MARRRKRSRNYDYSPKSGSEEGLRADKRRTRIFIIAVVVLGGAAIALLIHLWMIK